MTSTGPTDMAEFMKENECSEVHRHNETNRFAGKKMGRELEEIKKTHDYERFLEGNRKGRSNTTLPSDDDLDEGEDAGMIQSTPSASVAKLKELRNSHLSSNERLESLGKQLAQQKDIVIELRKEIEDLQKTNQELHNGKEKLQEEVSIVHQLREEKMKLQNELNNVREDLRQQSHQSENLGLEIENLREFKTKHKILVRELQKVKLFDITVGDIILDLFGDENAPLISLDELLMKKHPEIIRFYSTTDKLVLENLKKDLKTCREELFENKKTFTNTISELVDEKKKLTNSFDTELSYIKATHKENEDKFSQELSTLRDQVQVLESDLFAEKEETIRLQEENDDKKTRIAELELLEGDKENMVVFDKETLTRFGVNGDIAKYLSLTQVNSVDRITLINTVKRIMIFLQMSYTDLPDKIQRLAVYLQYEKPLLRKFVNELHRMVFGEPIDLVNKAAVAYSQFSKTGDMNSINHPLEKCLNNLIDHIAPA